MLSGNLASNTEYSAEAVITADADMTVNADGAVDAYVQISHNPALLAFSSDDRTFVSASVSGTINAWSRASRSVINTFRAEMNDDSDEPFLSMAVSPDAKMIGASTDDSMRIWDLSSGIILHDWQFSPEHHSMFDLRMIVFPRTVDG